MISRRTDHLGNDLPLVKLFHEPLVKHFFMGGVLVNDIKPFIIFNSQYVSKKLPAMR